MTCTFSKGDKVKVLKDDKYISGKVSSIEETVGYKKLWKYNIIHIKTQDGTMAAVEWEVIIDKG